MKSQKVYFAAAVGCLTLLACSFAIAGQTEGPIVRGEAAHTVSRPVRELSTSIHPQLAAMTLAPVVSQVLSFDGQSAPAGKLYSDATGAVGATQYVQLVNSQYTVYDKTTGALIAGPVAANSLWSTFGGSCQTANDPDGTVMYDQLANVWVLQHHASPTGGPNLNCVAVSTSSDATGTYNLYGFGLTLQFPDKPKLGLWPDAYYLSQDLLDSTGVFIRSQVCALDRTAMLAGTFARSICFQGSISLPTFVVSTLDGQTLPPAGEPEFVWQLDQRPNNGRNNLNSFQFHVDWTNPNSTTFTGPVANVLPAYTDTCASFRPCIGQPNTTNPLQGWGDRLIGRVSYRNFGTYESVVMTHAISRSVNLVSHSAVRWYEYRTPMTPVIFQSGTFNPDTTNRWIPNIAQDKFGDIAISYNVSSSTVFPGLRYTGHAITDKIGIMEAETTLVTGAGSQISNHYWPSYAGLALDPVDDCTFWVTGEYYPATSKSGWKTQVASFRFPSCTN